MQSMKLNSPPLHTHPYPPLPSPPKCPSSGHKKALQSYFYSADSGGLFLHMLTKKHFVSYCSPYFPMEWIGIITKDVHIVVLFSFIPLLRTYGSEGNRRKQKCLGCET